MVEPVMYLAIGFLISMLFGLMIVPLVHSRAVRLTTRRLEAAAPRSMAEIQAEKDHLRAEFAMSARRLELNVDQLRNKTTSQAAELGRKTEAVQRMRLELDEKKSEIIGLEASVTSLNGRLQSSADEISSKEQALLASGAAMVEKQANLLKLTSELSSTTLKADTLKVELVAASAHVASMKNRVEDADKDLAASRYALELQRAETETASRELAEAREQIKTLSQQAAELDQKILAQMQEAETLTAQSAGLQSQLTNQTRAIGDSEFEQNQLRQQNETLEAIARDLRVQVAAMSGGKSPAFDKLQVAKAAVEERLRTAIDDKAALQRKLRKIQQQTESAWATERTENALLRERINEIAAEVAKLALQLEGPGSTIEAILTADPSKPRGNAKAPATTRPTPNITLADRIRVLQAQTTKS